MTSTIDKARTLTEALPYIKRWSGRTVVIKYGGNAMQDPDAIRSFVGDVVLMHHIGIRPVIVHGAGPQISDMLTRLQHETRFVDGYRVTGEQEIDVVRMVLQKTNKEIVSLVNQHGDLAVGISGEDGNLIRATKMSAPSGADLGLVGVVDRVDPRVLNGLLASGFLPVVAPMGLGPEGQALNISADLAAGAVATALRAAKLVYLTDVEGLYRDFGDQGSLMSKVDTGQLRALLDEGSLSEGMIPKVTSCLEAVTGGVERAHILDGRVEHALLLEIFTDSGVGTMVEAS